jgi:hypothetical protein
MDVALNKSSVQGSLNEGRMLFMFYFMKQLKIYRSRSSQYDAAIGARFDHYKFAYSETQRVGSRQLALACLFKYTLWFGMFTTSESRFSKQKWEILVVAR